MAVRPQDFTWTNADLLSIEHLQWNFDRNLNISIQENTFENVVCKNGGHVVLVPTC